MTTRWLNIDRWRIAVSPEALVVPVALVLSAITTPLLVPMGEEGLRLALSVLLLGPIAWLAYRGSPHAVPYLVAVIVFNRGLRRLFDWLSGEFSAVTVLSILPALMASVLGVAALMRWKTAPKLIRLTCGFVLILLAYGSVLGLRNGIGFAVALSDYTSILAVTLYASTIRLTPRDLDRWLRSFVIIAALAVGYGWYQFIVLPPWDESWMIWSEMNSLGDPEPGGFRTFSTMASPGPYSMFLAIALLPAVLNRRWRPGGWLLPLFILTGLLLTLVRSTWLIVVVGLFAWAVASRAAEVARIGVVAALLVAVMSLALPQLPGGERIAARMGSFTSLGEDESAEERQTLLLDFPQMVAANPLGKGLGSTGTAVRLANSEKPNVALDNGFFFYFLTFGAVGGVAFLAIGILVWRGLTGGNFLPPLQSGPGIRITFTLYLTILAGLSATNVIADASVWAVWALIGGALSLLDRRVVEVEEERHMGPATESSLYATEVV